MSNVVLLMRWRPVEDPARCLAMTAAEFAVLKGAHEARHEATRRWLSARCLSCQRCAGAERVLACLNAKRERRAVANTG